jgi:hypothetical protein
MKKIAIIICRSLALATLLVTATVPAFGQGTLVIQHTGATDPLTEGYTKLGPGSGYPVINDMGVNAWVAPGISNLNVFYNYILTPRQQAESAGAGWILSADLRITTTNSFPMFGLTLDGYGLNFGSDSNGNQYVLYGSGGTDHVTLPGSSYNDYQLVYDASLGTVSLWINGIVYANNIFTNQHETYLQEVSWGSGYYGAQIAQANWNMVSLVITPEPSTICLLLLGTGILFYVSRRNRYGL